MLQDRLRGSRKGFTLRSPSFHSGWNIPASASPWPATSTWSSPSGRSSPTPRILWATTWPPLAVTLTGPLLSTWTGSSRSRFYKVFVILIFPWSRQTLQFFQAVLFQLFQSGFQLGIAWRITCTWSRIGVGTGGYWRKGMVFFGFVVLNLFPFGFNGFISRGRRINQVVWMIVQLQLIQVHKSVDLVGDLSGLRNA